VAQARNAVLGGRGRRINPKKRGRVETKRTPLKGACRRPGTDGGRRGVHLESGGGGVCVCRSTFSRGSRIGTLEGASLGKPSTLSKNTRLLRERKKKGLQRRGAFPRLPGRYENLKKRGRRKEHTSNDHEHAHRIGVGGLTFMTLEGWATCGPGGKACQGESWGSLQDRERGTISIQRTDRGEGSGNACATRIKCGPRRPTVPVPSLALEGKKARRDWGKEPKRKRASKTGLPVENRGTTGVSKLFTYG